MEVDAKWQIYRLLRREHYMIVGGNVGPDVKKFTSNLAFLHLSPRGTARAEDKGTDYSMRLSRLVVTRISYAVPLIHVHTYVANLLLGCYRILCVCGTSCRSIQVA